MFFFGKKKNLSMQPAINTVITDLNNAVEVNMKQESREKNQRFFHVRSKWVIDERRTRERKNGEKFR